MLAQSEQTTSIPIPLCLTRMKEWFQRPEQVRWFGHLPISTLMEAIKLIMESNIMKLGDIFSKMIKGIAMGTAPAPPIANIFMGAYEEDNVVGKFDERTPFLHRLIDDGLGVWERHPDPSIDQMWWVKFKEVMNASGLNWVFSERGRTTIQLENADDPA